MMFDICFKILSQKRTGGDEISDKIFGDTSIAVHYTILLLCTFESFC